MLKVTAIRRVFSALTFLFVMSLFSGLAFAWTISSNFDSGTAGQPATGTSGIDWVTGITYSKAMAHSGTQSAAATFVSGSADSTGGSFYTGVSPVGVGGEIWYRAYMYFPSGWNWACNPVVKIMRIPAAQYFDSIFATADGGIQLSNEPAGIQTYSSPATFDIGKWQCLEIYVKLGTTDGTGIIRIWKNGILVQQDNHMNTSGAQVDPAYILFNYWNGGAPQTQTAYVDDVVITTDTPSNVDAAGNHMIGPTNWSGSSPPVVNGACGSASGQSFSSLTSSSPNLCATGTVASFTGTGPWTWGCNGSGGGTNTASNACSASLTTPVVNGATTANLLLSESFEDSNFSSRGWYDGTTQGTIVSGGQSGNCLQWAWTAGQMLPNNVSGMMRMKFTPTDKMYVSFYVKFQTGWRGSEMAYHPHVLSVLSNLDGDWDAPGDSYLNTYIEFLSDTTSPYAIHPHLQLQDSKRTNTSYGSVPIDISAITENRSVNYCNGYKTGADIGTARSCFLDATPLWYSSTEWVVPNSSLSTNAWHHVEAYFQMNSINGGIGQPDGIMQEWVDGTQVLNKNNILYRTGYGSNATQKWAQFDLQAYIGSPGSPINQTMWLDELKVYDGLPSGVAANPASPTGLTAIVTAK